MHRRGFLAGVGACGAAPAWAAQELAFTYRGFSLKAPGRLGAPRAIRTAFERQFDIIIDADLPAPILAFMRTKTVNVVAPGTFKGPGHYAGARGIEIIPTPASDKPIVLHEMLHALHAEWLPQGRQNPDILAAYREARRTKAWPSDEYVMSNDNEFFAVTGSIYLFGKIDRAPYNRANIRKALPDYYQWLAKVFDNGRAR